MCEGYRCFRDPSHQINQQLSVLWINAFQGTSHLQVGTWQPSKRAAGVCTAPPLLWTPGFSHHCCREGGLGPCGSAHRHKQMHSSQLTASHLGSNHFANTSGHHGNPGWHNQVDSKTPTCMGSGHPQETTPCGTFQRDMSTPPC